MRDITVKKIFCVCVPMVSADLSCYDRENCNVPLTLSGRTAMVRVVVVVTVTSFGCTAQVRLVVVVVLRPASLFHFSRFVASSIYRSGC